MGLIFTETLRAEIGGKALRAYEVTCDGSTVSIDAANLDLHYIDSAAIAGAADITGTVSITVSNLADAVGSTLTVTLAGAVLGDAVEVAGSEDMDDITLTAYVKQAGTVEIRLQNEGNGTKTPANGYICRIRKTLGLKTFTGANIVFSPPLRSGDKFALWAFGW